MSRNWYVLRSRWELRVCEAVRGLELGAYVPCETVLRRVGREPPKPFLRPVVPGYVFVRCEPGDLGVILALDGAFDFVRVEMEDGVRYPAAMDSRQLQWLFLCELYGELDHTRKPKEYKPERGDRVRVRSGKWAGYVGRIISVGKRKTLMQFERGLGKVELQAEHLEAA